MHPIGIFDSGYGGLTVFKKIVNLLPYYDYIYFGDNARAPYGTRSFDTIYRYTLECTQKLFALDCALIILACNTASAKALRTIQQVDLVHYPSYYRVLGVIRPTVEEIGHITRTRRVGILATPGTVQSNSYLLEINNLYPDIEVYQQACPMWVPLVENGEYHTPGADYFVEQCIEKLLAQNSDIDTIILGCTHYPILLDTIRKFISPEIQVLSQGPIVAKKLADYLNRHSSLEQVISRGGTTTFFTTDRTEDFDAKSSLFFGKEVKSRHFELE